VGSPGDLAHKGEEMTSVKDRAVTGLVLAEPLIFDRTTPGRRGSSETPARFDRKAAFDAIPAALRRQDAPAWPECSEVEVVRHFTRMSRWNYAIDLGTYPLGSCTMKYNPKVNEDMARLAGFAALHPYAPLPWVQGALELICELEHDLGAVSGLPAVSLQPAAGAHAEMTGVMVMRKHLESKGDPRKKVLIPDSAHGTNPASCALNGYDVLELKSNADGLSDPAEVARLMDVDVAGIMVTNPNTLGLFESHMGEIAEIVHAKGGLVYCDGANLNSLLGVARPGDFGVDHMHINLHKTFSTPHGGGGPGAGALCVTNALERYLPSPRIRKQQAGDFVLDAERPHAVGRVKAFFGNFGMHVRAFTYIRELGFEGLRQATEMAVLNANYVRARLSDAYHVPHDRPCMHEVVLTDKRQQKNGVSTMDVAKNLIDYGYHPPTVYFPICVHGALMIEPTETETKADLDELCDALIEIAATAESAPEGLHAAPTKTHVGRLDEVQAARRPILRYQAN